jgi:hypothetical protein
MLRWQIVLWVYGLRYALSIMFGLFRLLFSRAYWLAVFRGQTWMSTWVAFRRVHKDKRAWKQFSRTLYLLLVPLAIPVAIGYVLLAIGGGMAAGIVLLWGFIGLMMGLKRMGFGKSSATTRPDAVFSLDLVERAHFMPSAALRREIAELCLLHAVIADRSGSERFLQLKVVPEGFEVITRRRHLDLLREYGIYDRLGTVERDLLLMADGHWSMRTIDAGCMALEPVRLLRWLLRLDHYLPTTGETLVGDYQLAAKTLADPAAAFAGDAFVLEKSLDRAMTAAHQYFYRCWAEGVKRGLYTSEKPEVTAELKEHAAKLDGAEGEDLLLGSRIVSKAEDSDVRLGATLGLRRVEILGWIGKRVKAGAEPLPTLVMFYPPPQDEE